MSDPSPSSSARRKNFLAAFLASVLGTGMSRVLGALRDIALAGFLGAGVASDTFWIAFTIPSVFRRFVADEGLTGALIPALARAEAEGEDPRPLANTVLTALLASNLVLCAAGIAAAPWLVAVFAPSWVDQPEKFELTVALTRVMFPFVALVSLVSYFEGLLNHRGHFFVPKLAPGLVSAGIIGALMLFAGGMEQPGYAAAGGLLVGGVVHVMVNLPWVWSRWGRVGLGTAFRDPRFRRILIELSKVIAIGLFAQINIIVLRQVATSLGTGAVTWYQYATRLIDLAQGAVAVGIGSALLPDVSKSVAQQAWHTFRDDVVGAIRLAAFLIFPAGAVLVAFAEPVCSLLYRHGQYTWQDVVWTADTLRLLLPFLIALAGANIVKKIYFALEDRGTLLKVGGLGVVLTGGLGVLLAAPLGVSGLALALSISTSVQLALYLWVLHRRLGEHLGLSRLIRPLSRMAAACVGPVVVLLLATPLGNWPAGPSDFTNLAVAAVALPLAGLAYGLLAWMLGIEELNRVVGRLTRRFGR